eukprot:8457073-Pyramimonas_sp.AAC.1
MECLFLSVDCSWNEFRLKKTAPGSGCFSLRAPECNITTRDGRAQQVLDGDGGHPVDVMQRVAYQGRNHRFSPAPV